MSHQCLLSGLTGTVKADFSGLAVCTVHMHGRSNLHYTSNQRAFNLIYLLLGIYAVPKWCTGIVPEVIKYTTCYLWLSYKQGFGIRFGKKIRSQPNWTNFGKIRMNFGLNSVKFRNVKHKIRFGPHRNGRISPKFGLIQSNPRTLLTSTINSYVDVARPN
jgi:hypothetical protein